MVGNAVPCKLSQELAESIYKNLTQTSVDLELSKDNLIVDPESPLVLV